MGPGAEGGGDISAGEPDDVTQVDVSTFIGTYHHHVSTDEYHEK